MTDKKEVIKNNVAFVGLDCVDSGIQRRIKDIIEKEFIILERELKHIHGLKFHLKEHNKDSNKQKYSVKLVVEAATGPLIVDKSSLDVQWDPVAMTHEIMKKARREIMHKYKTDSSYRKDYEKGSL